MQAQQTDASERPFIVRRSDIPVSADEADVDLETKRFLDHQCLGPAVREAATTLAWLRARHGQNVARRSHASPSLIIVLNGSAKVVGGVTGTVERGDVITIPANHAYEFSSVGPQGLDALHVTFLEAAYESSRKVVTLELLLERNQERARAALSTPYFGLLSGGGLSSASSRTRFRDCLRVFSDAFQTFLFTRQAMCRDDEYQALFHEHLVEELGHNRMLRASQNPTIFNDPVLKATSLWFTHQMLVMDNVGKAVVNLVLETAGYHFHSLATPVFKGDEGAEYFGTHAEADEHHKDVGVELLGGQHPDTYLRLHGVLEDSWNMLEAVTQRIFELVGTEQPVASELDVRASDIREISGGHRQEHRRSHG